MTRVHLHASHAAAGETGCLTVCGIPCDREPVAYRGLDPERVTCEGCRPAPSWETRRAVMVRVGDETPAGIVDEIRYAGSLRRTSLRIGPDWFDRANDELVDVAAAEPRP